MIIEVRTIEFLRMGRKIIINRTVNFLEATHQEIIKNNVSHNDKEISSCNNPQPTLELIDDEIVNTSFKIRIQI